MTTLPLVYLNDQWEWFSSQASSTLPSQEAVWKPLRSLGSLTHLDGAEEVLWLRMTFALEPLEVCVRYLLRLEGEIEALYLNGAEMSPTGVPHGLDVTDHVALEDNVLVLKLSGGLAPGRIWLQPVPCGDD